MARTHFPSVVNEKLIEFASTSPWPSTFDFLTLSDPAKSTKYSLDSKTVVGLVLRVLTPFYAAKRVLVFDFWQVRSNTVWLRLDWSLNLV